MFLHKKFIIIVLFLCGFFYFFKNNNLKLTPVKVVYRNDRYEMTKSDCKSSLSNNVSYHSVAVIEVFFNQKIDWAKIDFVELEDKANSLEVKYTIDHKKSEDNVIFYHTPLFSKERHYEFISLEEDNRKSVYLFYYYNQYGELKQKNSFIKIKGVSFDKEDVFKTEDVVIDYNHSYKKKNFPVFKDIKKSPIHSNLTIKFDNSEYKGTGVVQYKYQGKMKNKKFLTKKGLQTLEVPIEDYDSYLAVTLSNEIGYENKKVLFRTCNESY